MRCNDRMFWIWRRSFHNLVSPRWRIINVHDDKGWKCWNHWFIIQGTYFDLLTSNRYLFLLIFNFIKIEWFKRQIRWACCTQRRSWWYRSSRRRWEDHSRNCRSYLCRWGELHWKYLHLACNSTSSNKGNFKLWILELTNTFLLNYTTMQKDFTKA